MSKIEASGSESLSLIQNTPISEPEILHDVLKKAKQAQKKWESISLQYRKKLFKNLLIYISKNYEQIARIIFQETSKPKLEAINSDILAGLAAIRYSIDYIDKILKPYKIKFKGMRLPMRYMGRASYIYPKPLGVIGIISPWNFPFGIPFSQVVMATAAGNAVILKPSSATPLTGKKIQELFIENGFPKDLVQVIVGQGSMIGNALVHSDINRIIFTGSVEVGRHIMREAAQVLTPITLELGGKSPMIVLEDADLERCVNGAIYGAFLNSGQVCSGVKRIYVHETIYKEFLQRFKEKTEKLKQGYGWDDTEVSMGPLINEEAVKEMEKQIERAKEQGAKILTGGKRNSNLKGNFFEPSILINVVQKMDVVKKEIFGPIVPVLSFSTDEEAIDLANDTSFGLYGSVWTNDLKRGEKIAQRLTMGTIAINNHTYTYGIPHTPWGGNKNSGYGRTHGRFGFEELIQTQHIHLDNQRIKSDSWWQPYNSRKLEAQLEIMNVIFLKKYHRMISLIKKL